MKKSILFFILMLMSLIASAGPVEIDGIYYNLVSKVKTAEVTSNPNMYSGKVVIPQTVTYGGKEYNVTSIGPSAFSDCSSLTSITIPNSVTSIGSIAFSNCSSLTSITIPNSVTSIGSIAFSDCSSLTSITIPNSVSSIGSEVFAGCSGLTSVTIPNSVKSIGRAAFSDCSSITSITIPNSVKSIGSSAFSECSSLTTITIPNSVNSIGGGAFYGCSSLASVTIPNSVTIIGSDAEAGAFENCTRLTSVTIPNNVHFIGQLSFSGCTSLTSITIGRGVKVICNHAFAECPDLTDVYCYAEKLLTDEDLDIDNPESFAFAETDGLYTTPDAFEGSYIEYATLHVPKDCSEAYKAMEPWKKFKSIVEIVNAKVELSKTDAIIEKGKTLTLKATVTPTDLPDKSVTWESSNTKVATVSSTGKVKGVKAGTATITCTSNSTGAKATCKVTIGYVKLDKTEATIQKGKTATLSATVYPSSLTDKSVTWESSDTKIATVTTAGKVKGVKAGTATITCTSNATGLKATSTVTVGYVKLDKTEATLLKGKTTTLKATVYPSSLTDKSVTWESSDTKIATVTTAGKVKGVKAGTATITCTSNATGLKATCTVTVGYVKLDKTEATFLKGETTTLKATVYPSSLTDKSVTWESSDTKVATVSTAGKVKGVKAGTATITCTSNATGLKATCTVNVVGGFVTLNKTETYVQKGKTMTLKATVTPETLTDKSVTWESSDTKIATVSSAGKVKGVKYGTATITCTSVATGAKATCKVTIGKVVVGVSEITLKRSRSVTLDVTLYPTDLADKSVTWESSDESIATVTSEGKVTGVKAGTATITCTSVATGLKGTCSVTVLSVIEARSVIGNGDDSTGINDYESPSVVEPFDVYDLSGRKVRHQVTSLDGLPDGIYIVNGKKVLKK